MGINSRKFWNCADVLKTSSPQEDTKLTDYASNYTKHERLHTQKLISTSLMMLQFEKGNEIMKCK